MVCPNKEICLEKKKEIEHLISKFDDDAVPIKLLDELEAINKKLAKIEKVINPLNSKLHFTENAISGN